MSFFPPTALDTSEAEAIARGLYAVSRRDGVHEREAALIASFWADCGGGAVALAELARQPDIGAEQLAGLLRGADKQKLFLKTAVLLAWADGNASDREMALINDFAKGFGLGETEVQELAAEVKEYLLSHLTHLQNTASTVSVAKKLGV
jgi:tellurite resistance protein